MSRLLPGCLWGLLCLLWTPHAHAHEIRPAYLQIDALSPGTYDVLWKVPRRSASVLDIEPVFDARFALSRQGKETVLEGFVVYRYRLSGEPSLAGTSITIRDLARTTVDVIGSVRLQNGSRHNLLLQPTAPTAIIPGDASGWSVVTTYASLGVEHILLGFDHLAFVFALLLLTGGFWRTVKTVTAFTLAHSVTLSLAALGWVEVPAPPVEATIALSIVFVASEVLRARSGEPTLAGTRPWLIAFTFGLLHGLGFAGALSEIGLPQGEIPLALACFNLGVELGQVGFLGLAMVSIRALARVPWLATRARVLCAYAIGGLGAYWVFDRLGAVLS